MYNYAEIHLFEKPKTLGLQLHLVIVEGFKSDKIFPKGILHKEIHVNTVM